jgi:hypothetical protein
MGNDGLSIELMKTLNNVPGRAITFMTPDELRTIALPTSFHLIFDEYQSLFAENLLSLSMILRKATSFIGASGSPSEPEHISLLLSYIPNGLYVSFPE